MRMQHRFLACGLAAVASLCLVGSQKAFGTLIVIDDFRQRYYGCGQLHEVTRVGFSDLTTLHSYTTTNGSFPDQLYYSLL